MTKYAYIHGDIVPIEQASISLLNNTFHYGTGCFGGIRGYWNEEQEQLYVFRIEDHFRRFLNSAKMLLCEFDVTPADLAKVTVDLLQREGWRQNCYIRPVAYKDVDCYRVWLHDGNDDIATMRTTDAAWKALAKLPLRRVTLGTTHEDHRFADDVDVAVLKCYEVQLRPLIAAWEAYFDA